MIDKILRVLTALLTMASIWAITLFVLGVVSRPFIGVFMAGWDIWG